MKLINKFTLWYIAITLLVLALGGIILFYSIQSEIRKNEIKRLRKQLELTARRIQSGESIANSELLRVIELPNDSKRVAFNFKDTIPLYHHRFREEGIKASESFPIGDHHFLITAYQRLPERHQISEGIVNSLIGIGAILLIVIIVLSRWMSSYLIRPLKTTLQSIQTFNIKQTTPAMFSSETSTQEFKTLGDFLDGMSAKAKAEYLSLKEFTENASHELQTPLAVIRTKIELLIDLLTTEEQANLVLSTQKEVERLTHINKGLLLLARLENQEYEKSTVHVSGCVEQAITAFRELMEISELSLTTEIEQEVMAEANAGLFEILLSNLLSNSIRHNQKGGQVKVTLTTRLLTVENSGGDPLIPTDQLFKRFKKSNQSTDTTGLGLAIVKQICELHGFTISYNYMNGLHTICIALKPN
jgi:two-component system OmpR family sensor kinase